MQVPRTEILIRALDGSELLRADLTPGEYVLGRDEACHVCIDAEQVAAQHAQLTINFDHALIEDLGSESGTLVNGQRVTDSVRLWPGQRIQVGSAIIELHRQQMTAQADVSLAPQAAITKTLLPPELLRERRYEVGGVVARGGMGAILNATEAAIERAVAMKVMLENSSADDLVRFIAEAKVTGQLEHPNIVPVHELGVDENDQVFYTMKFVRGITLKKVLELMAAGTEATIAKYPLGTLLTIFQKVCDAMAFAHSKGVIHRDLKPENIMLGDYGEVLVMDWGLAKVLGGGASVRTVGSGAWRAVSPDATGATMRGTIMGTPQYMAPEQARGEVDSLDERADIYALGAILYHILALRPSVSGDDAWAIVERVARGEVDPLGSGDIPVAVEPSRAGGAPSAGKVAGSARRVSGRRQECRRSIPDSLAAVVRKAMAFDRAQRYASVADLQADLTAFQNGFATTAEQASALRQLHLLMLRHKALAFSIAAIVAVTAGFMGKVIHSERAATAAKIAAERSEAAAKKAEAVALEKSEAARAALARSQTSLAEAAYREFDSRAMLAALDGVPEDLRDADWRYLRARADNSQTAFTFAGGKPGIGVAAHPKKPGVFACAPSGGTIVFVDALSGQRVSEFALSERQRKNSYSRSLDFSPDGARLLVGRLGAGGVAIYDTNTGQPLAEWDATDVDLVRFSLDGTKTLEIAANGELIVHDATSGRVLWRSSGVRRALFTPAGQVLTTSARSVRLHDAATGAVVKNLPDIREDGGFLALSPDGATLFIGGADGVVRGMRLADGTIVFEHRLIDGRRYVRVAISGDGRRMLAAADLSGGQRVARVLDLATASVTQTLLGGAGVIEGIALHPLTDEAIISGPDTRTWATTTREAESKVSAGSSAAVFWGAEDVFAAWSKPLRFGADGRWSDLPFTLPPECIGGNVADSAGEFAAFGKYVGTGSPVAIYRKTGDTFTLLHTVRTKAALARIRLSRDGQRLATVNAYSTLEVFDTASGQRLSACDESAVKYVRDLAWIGSERIAAVGVRGERGAASATERVVVWDAKTGRVLREVRGSGFMDALAVAPDGRTLAEGGEDKRIRLRDAETLEVRREFRAHDGAISALAFHPTKPILASGSLDFTVRLWSLDDLSLIEEVRPSAVAPMRLAFSPGGTRLASTDQGSAATILRLDTPPLGKFTRRSTTSAPITTTDQAATRAAADAHVRAGRFAEARDGFAGLVKAGSTDIFDFMKLAMLHAQLGDTAAYRAHCHVLLERFGASTSATTMERAGKSCLLLPIDEADRAIVLRLAHGAIVADPNGAYRDYFKLADGLAHYREGNFAKAAEVLAPLASNGIIEPMSAPLLALAQHRLGKIAEARATLARADALVVQISVNDTRAPWHDLILPHILIEEARAAIGK